MLGLQGCLASGFFVCVLAASAAGQVEGAGSAGQVPSSQPACTPIVEYLLPDPPVPEARDGLLAPYLLVAGCAEQLSTLTARERTSLLQAFSSELREGAIIVPEARPDRPSRARVAATVNQAVGRPVVSDWVLVRRSGAR